MQGTERGTCTACRRSAIHKLIIACSLFARTGVPGLARNNQHYCATDCLPFGPGTNESLGCSKFGGGPTRVLLQGYTGRAATMLPCGWLHPPLRTTDYGLRTTDMGAWGGMMGERQGLQAVETYLSLSRCFEMHIITRQPGSILRAPVRSYESSSTASVEPTSPRFCSNSDFSTNLGAWAALTSRARLKYR